ALGRRAVVLLAFYLVQLERRQRLALAHRLADAVEPRRHRLAGLVEEVGAQVVRPPHAADHLLDRDLLEAPVDAAADAPDRLDVAVERAHVAVPAAAQASEQIAEAHCPSLRVPTRERPRARDVASRGAAACPLRRGPRDGARTRASRRRSAGP